MSSLDAITLPAMHWTDETTYSPVEAEPDFTLAGAMILQPSVKLAGRPITLAGGPDFGWTTWQTWLDLSAYAEDPTRTMTLTLPDGRTKSVRFNYSGGAPVTATLIVDYIPPLPADECFLTLRLIEV